MRNALVFGIALLVAGGLVLAQDHNNATEKAVKADLTFTSDVRVGTLTLPAGEYRVVCNRETISFTPAEGGKSVKLPCKGAELNAPSEQTEAHLAKGPSGGMVLQKLLLKGSSIAHTFD